MRRTTTTIEVIRERLGEYEQECSLTTQAIIETEETEPCHATDDRDEACCENDEGFGCDGCDSDVEDEENSEHYSVGYIEGYEDGRGKYRFSLTEAWVFGLALFALGLVIGHVIPR